MGDEIGSSENKIRFSPKWVWEARGSLALFSGILVIIFGGIRIFSEFSYGSLLILLLGVIITFAGLRLIRNPEYYSKNYAPF